MRKIETDTRIGKSKRRLGGDGIVRKTARLLSQLLNWAVDEQRLPINPLKGNMKLKGDGERDTVISTPEEYARLFAAMDDLVVNGKPRLRPDARAFITIAALTGMRRSELQNLTWGNVDLEGRRLTLHNTKGAKLARSGPRTQTVSLPPRAAEALADLKPDDALPHELVFVPLQGKTIAVNIDWRRIRAAAGLPADLTLHGLRHSIGTAAVIAGMNQFEIQKLLRHKKVSTTARYIHLAEQQQNRLQDRAMAHLDPEPKPPASPLRLVPKIT
jgi:integrase